MIYIDNLITDPHFNLAAEEYLLKNFSKDIFMLWRNTPSIVVGKYQNTLAEINPGFVWRNNVSVVRRFTGGGAVYHDLGNLNFTFIEHNDLGDFSKFSRIIVDMLAGQGITAEVGERNDLTIDGLKISGSAQCVHKNKVMHHGTLLFSSVLPDLKAALHNDNDNFEDKSVKSVRSKVTNICDYLKQPIDINVFKELLIAYFVKSNPEAQHYTLNDTDIRAINQLKQEKYVTWDWNFGRSPHYSFSRQVKLKNGNLGSHIDVDKGRIVDIKLYADFLSNKEIEELEQLIKGYRHETIELTKRLLEVGFENYINNTKVEEVIKVMI